jgi:hypothetical protein
LQAVRAFEIYREFVDAAEDAAALAGPIMKRQFEIPRNQMLRVSRRRREWGIEQNQGIPGKPILHRMQQAHGCRQGVKGPCRAPLAEFVGYSLQNGLHIFCHLPLGVSARVMARIPTVVALI